MGIPCQCSVTLAQLSEKLSLAYVGNAERVVSSINTLQDASASELSFLSDQRHLADLVNTDAGIVILSSDFSEQFSGDKLISDDPYLSYAQAVQLMYPPEKPGAKKNIHPSAVIDPTANVSDKAFIGPYVVVEKGASIGDFVEVGAQSFIGANVVIGKRTTFKPSVTVHDYVKIGERCIVHSGAVIGADGFGFALDTQRQWEKIPQIGSVLIEDDVEVGANTTIDRGALGDTVIECGVKLDNLVQVAHNVRLGAHTAVAGCTAIAGSSTIGQYCQIGGGSGITGHISIVDHVVVGAMSFVTKSIRESGLYVGAFSAQPDKIWHKQVAWLKQQVKKQFKLRRK